MPYPGPGRFGKTVPQLKDQKQAIQESVFTPLYATAETAALMEEKPEGPVKAGNTTTCGRYGRPMHCGLDQPRIET